MVKYKKRNLERRMLKVRFFRLGTSEEILQGKGDAKLAKLMNTSHSSQQKRRND